MSCSSILPQPGASRANLTKPACSKAERCGRLSNGKTHSLAQYKGKYVVLEWFNPECPFVKKHYGSDNMQKLQQEYTSKGVVWLSIDSSAPGAEGNLTPEQAKSTINSWKTKQTALLLDP